MYQSVKNVFSVETPKARVYEPSMTREPLPYYLQVVADYGTVLNRPQIDAVTTVDGPVLIVAGAGAGKTTVLTNRIGYMINSVGIDPATILLVTFTKKAAVEMTERLARIPGVNRQLTRQVTAGTYHSICLNILRSEGYDFQVLSSERRQHIMLKTILKKMNLHENYSAEDIAAIISSWKNKLIRPQDVQQDTAIKKELVEIYKQYEQMKDEQNLYDFDDFLIETYYLFMFNEDVLKRYQEQFQYVLCDEFQDSSFVQYQIVKMISEPHNNICIVGDDAQTIYSWRAASSKYMLDFDKEYPNCRRVVMDVNYRSVPAIVGFGNSLIHRNEKQIKKTLLSAKHPLNEVQFSRPINSDMEAEQIVEEIRQAQITGTTSLKEIAVIYRTHAVGRAIFDRLLLADIPFVTYGRSKESFYQSTFVRPVLSLLKAITYSNDTKAMIEAAPLFYLSKADMEQAINSVSNSYEENTSDLFTKALRYLADRKSGFQQTQLAGKIDSLKILAKMTSPQAIQEIRKGTIGYENQLEVDGRKTISINKEMLLEVLDEFEQASLKFRTIESFLSFIQKVDEKNAEMEELRQNPNIEAVRLMTIHSAKGLEYDKIFAIGWIEGVLPHAASLNGDKTDTELEQAEMLEEERRLAYVASSRAREKLYISAPLQHRGKEAEISRFVYEGLNLDAPIAKVKGAVVNV